MTLVPNSSLGIQNTSSLLTGSSHIRVLTVRDPNRPHVVDSRPRIDQTWLIAVRTRHMEKLGARTARSDSSRRREPLAICIAQNMIASFGLGCYHDRAFHVRVD